MRPNFRKADASDGEIIKELLYHAIFIPKAEKPAPKEIIEKPELSKYYENWKRVGDIGYIASLDGKEIGAIWLRLFECKNKGYGFIDEKVPEMSMAVIPAYRNLGIGSQLFDTLLADDELLRYKAISLSVHRKNRAVRLYQRYGFKVFDENGESYIMKKVLADI